MFQGACVYGNEICKVLYIEAFVTKDLWTLYIVSIYPLTHKISIWIFCNVCHISFQLRIWHFRQTTSPHLNLSCFSSPSCLQVLIQFEEEICFGYTGSEWIKEKLNTFGISIFLDWSFIKRKQLCNVWERRMVFLWSWCWLGLESGKCKWWLWFEFFYSNICKLPQEVCMLEFFSLCGFFCCCCCCCLFFNMFVWCSASVWKLS